MAIVAQPFSHLPYDVQLERSAMLLDIEDRTATVARMEIEVGSQKEALIEALGLLVRTAECIRYGLEIGRVAEMSDSDLQAPLSLLHKARTLHEESRKTIAYERLMIEDLQRTLNDEEAWSDESTRQLEARKAGRRV